nr:hypothetical protein [Wolbachia endosymbiont of Oedothorax gibbosus]
MKYEIVKELNEEEFRRLTGVKKSTFNKMAGILCKENKKKKAKGGRAKRREHAAYGIRILTRIPDIFSHTME